MGTLDYEPRPRRAKQRLIAYVMSAVGFLVVVYALTSTGVKALSRAERDSMAEVDRAEWIFCRYAEMHGVFPGPSLAVAVSQISKDATLANILAQQSPYQSAIWRLIVSGKDAFGRPLIYECNDDRTSMRIRAGGTNGFYGRGGYDRFEAGWEIVGQRLVRLPLLDSLGNAHDAATEQSTPGRNVERARG